MTSPARKPTTRRRPAPQPSEPPVTLPETLAREASGVAFEAEALGETLQAFSGECLRFVATLRDRAARDLGAALHGRGGLLGPGAPLRQQQTVLHALEGQLLRQLGVLRARAADLRNNLRDLDEGRA
jgi:hypothetical protein